MASLLTHPIVPIAAAALVGRRIVPMSLLMLGVVFSMLPDLDVIAFRLGIPYASPFGHRGFSHSIVIAALFALMLVPCARRMGARPTVIFAFLFLSMASHGVLDAYTNAGLGVAFFWPFNSERIFFDFRPVEASPISVQRFLASRGWDVLRSELVWVWIPLLLFAFIGYGTRKYMESANPIDRS